MAVGFDSIPFTVVIQDDLYIPMPTRDDTGFAYLEATIRLASRANYDALDALYSRVTVLPAMAMVGGGLIVVEGGAGRKHLTLPLGNDGDEETRQAILTEIAPSADALRDVIQADVVFLVMEIIE